jgi:hypothetical protein
MNPGLAYFSSVFPSPSRAVTYLPTCETNTLQQLAKKHLVHFFKANKSLVVLRALSRTSFPDDPWR